MSSKLVHPEDHAPSSGFALDAPTPEEVGERLRRIAIEADVRLVCDTLEDLSGYRIGVLIPDGRQEQITRTLAAISRLRSAALSGAKPAERASSRDEP